MTGHERVMAVLARFDELSPLAAQEAMTALERTLALAIYDTDEVDTMHRANRIAVACGAYLSGVS